MTEKELRELDCWIAEHVFGLSVLWEETKGKYPQYLWSGKHTACHGQGCVTCRNTGNECQIVKHYTTDPAPAMMVLEKCAEENEDGLSIYKLRGQWVVNDPTGEDYSAATLHLAICLFARELKSTKTVPDTDTE